MKKTRVTSTRNVDGNKVTKVVTTRTTVRDRSPIKLSPNIGNKLGSRVSPNRGVRGANYGGRHGGLASNKMGVLSTSPQNKSPSPTKNKVKVSPLRTSSEKNNSSVNVITKLPSNSKSEITGSTLTDQEKIEHGVLAYTNLLRKNPSIFIPLLEEMKTYFNGKSYSIPGKTTILTQEGVPVINETIDYLKKVKIQKPLKYSVGMSLACRDHCKDTGPKGLVGHGGSNGSNPTSRSKLYVRFVGSWCGCGENISYGYDHPLQIVLQLLIDDGVPSRGHRTNLFNDTYVYCGVGYGSHKAYKHMCCIGYANNCEDLSQSVSSKISQPDESKMREIESLDKLIIPDLEDQFYFKVPEEKLNGIIENGISSDSTTLYNVGHELGCKVLSPLSTSDLTLPQDIVIKFSSVKNSKAKIDFIVYDKYFPCHQYKRDGILYCHGRFTKFPGFFVVIVDMSYALTWGKQEH